MSASKLNQLRGRCRTLATVGFILLSTALTVSIHAQSTVQFDVASIKQNTSGGNRSRFSVLPGGTLTVVNNALFNVIQNAYDIHRFQLVGAPEWIDSDSYDIEAKAGGNATRQEVMKMLQVLLEDRLKLKVHREVRELPIFTLSVVKGGQLPRFQEGSCAGQGSNNRVKENNTVSCNDDVMRQGKWDAPMIDMRQLSDDLSVMLGRRVIDRTGLSGLFSIHLEFSLDPLNADATRPTIFTALQDLGLKLESDKGPVEALIIDHVEKPSEN